MVGENMSGRLQYYTPTLQARKTRRDRTARWAWALFLLVQTARASAQEVDSEYDRTVNAALDEYERGNWDESSALFGRAHQLKPSARTLRGLGLSAYEGRHYPDAIHYLVEALADPRLPLNPLQRDALVATIDRARLFVGYLKISVKPDGSLITINGLPALTDTNGEIICDAGWIDLEIKADRHDTWNRHLRLSPGQHLALRANLTGQPIAATASTDSQTENDPSAATHSAPPLATTAGPYATWKWIAAGTAIAAVGAGGAMLLAQKLSTPDYLKDCVHVPTPLNDCKQRERLLGSQLWTGSIVSLSLGAAVAALTVALFVMDNRPDAQPPSALSCSGSGPLGIGCHLNF
jgi:hypothetical protein